MLHHIFLCMASSWAQRTSKHKNTSPHWTHGQENIRWSWMRKSSHHLKYNILSYPILAVMATWWLAPFTPTLKHLLTDFKQYNLLIMYLHWFSQLLVNLNSPLSVTLCKTMCKKFIRFIDSQLSLRKINLSSCKQTIKSKKILIWEKPTLSACAGSSTGTMKSRLLTLFCTLGHFLAFF